MAVVTSDLLLVLPPSRNMLAKYIVRKEKGSVIRSLLRKLSKLRHGAKAALIEKIECLELQMRLSICQAVSM